MFRNDVLDRFDQRRRFWRTLTIKLFVFFDICFLLELTAFAILVKSGTFKFPAPAIKLVTSAPPTSKHQSQNPAKSTDTKPPIAPAEAESLSEPLHTLPPLSLAPEPNTDRLTQQMLPTDIPMPPVRPSHLASTPEHIQSDELNTPNMKSSTKRDAPIEQTDGNKPPPNKPKLPDIDARRTAALDLERTYANADVPISTRISGPDGTILNLEYSQFNDALVQNIMSVRSFAATLSSVGFTMITFTGAQNKRWVFPLAASSQSNKSSQHPTSKSDGAGPLASKTVTEPRQQPGINQVGIGKPLQLLQ
jgi:hypothetical protein